MALSISPLDPSPISSISTTLAQKQEIAAIRKPDNDEGPHDHQEKTAQPLTPIDRIEISQEARQQARTVQGSSANPGAEQQPASLFDTE